MYVDNPALFTPISQALLLTQLNQADDKLCEVYDYTKLLYLAQGSSGVVYSTTRIGTDVKVAVKRMRFSDVCIIALSSLSRGCLTKKKLGPRLPRALQGSMARPY